MQVRVLQLLSGAKQATGLTVIIDVFRAFSTECVMYARGADRVLPVGSMEDAFRLREINPGSLLVGERGGARCNGFDAGNSPSELAAMNLNGKTIIHTTSAGTQGLAAAVHADELLTGSLNNASAIAAYIRERQPETVSLVCMGLAGVEPTDEDSLCAEYIHSLLKGKPLDVVSLAQALRYTSGAKFFDPAQQSAFPQADFPLCVKPDLYPFVIRVKKADLGFETEKIAVECDLRTGC